MSNWLGISAVTAAFGQKIATALQAVPHLSASPELRWGRPVSDPNFVGANVFLYRASPNAARRNDDLATRSQGGVVLQQPQLSLDLDYLISFHGEETSLEPQRLMGSVIASLHASPVLLPGDVQTAGATLGPALSPAVADQIAPDSPIRLTLQALNLESFYRIWSLFTQVPYALSVAYTASALMLQADLTPVRSGLVLERVISANLEEAAARLQGPK
jgi:hypothetical protein